MLLHLPFFLGSIEKKRFHHSTSRKRRRRRTREREKKGHIHTHTHTKKKAFIRHYHSIVIVRSFGIISVDELETGMSDDLKPK
jgi:hypothetical protein